MESAYLHGEAFNIELKRRELEQKNLTRPEIKNWFEERYRNFSKKSAFTCLCCNKPVNMNLTSDEGRPFFFKHFDGSECSYSENSKTYEKRVSTHEDKRRKDIGLTLFREILEGQLKPYGVQIERGYHYKKTLAFIPDFILTFPDTQELWAIDYFTSINQGVITGAYARHLSNRRKTYKEEGFKSFSFVDKSWLSFDEETNKGTLLNAEAVLANKSQEDLHWDDFLAEHIKSDLLKDFLKDYGLIDFYFDAKHIVYVDIEKRECSIFRFIELAKNQTNITYLKLMSSNVPIETALSIRDNEFMISSINNEDEKASFLNIIINKVQEIENRRNAVEQEKENRRIAEEQEREKELRNNANRLEQLNLQNVVDDEQLNRQMEETARKAALRPMWEDPNRKYQKYELYANPKYERSSVKYDKESEYDKKKKEKVMELLLSKPIEGDFYINNDIKKWRNAVLKWMENNQDRDTIDVSISKLVSALEGEGITINQPKLVKYPMKEFLDYYVKILKKELKKKLQLNITE